ncbi:hypothetical protein [Trichormus variabilis]|uniref:hypothetical protein n=1 Tax=Anabaena variabilis TaxID=264691 RepID=UPI00131F8C23|nr:hypothetical protein [Trichormus variabilis]MBC1259660.1 hypothetical protein [Trichormus variabilis V5]QHD83971.1 hypothetical protein GSQ19_29580 [Trichormus variabilis 0441]
MTGQDSEKGKGFLSFTFSLSSAYSCQYLRRELLAKEVFSRSMADSVTLATLGFSRDTDTVGECNTYLYLKVLFKLKPSICRCIF